MGVRPTAPTRRDVIIAAALAAVMVGELVGHDSDLAKSIPAALVACAALAWRRVWAVAAFLVTWSGLALLLLAHHDFDEFSVSFILVFFLSMYSLGAYADGREQPISYVLVTAATLQFLFNDGDKFHVGDIPFAVAVVGGPWAAGLAIRLRQERVRSVQAENKRLVEEQEEATRRAVAAERSTIARELHDVVSHAISVTVLQSRGARAMLGRDEAEVRKALDSIEQTNTAALGDMRRLLAVLRDTEPEQLSGWDEHAPQPSLAHLDRLVDQVRSSGVTIELDVVGDQPTVPPGVDLSAFRIIQEALTNVLKHADGARASVRLGYGVDALEVEISNDGTGTADPDAPSGGHGLVGIRERVAVVGGRVEAGPLPEGGFAVRARLPYSLETS